MNQIKKEFLVFLSQSQEPNDRLKLLTKKDIQLSFRKKNILTKFIFFQSLGGLFSLSVCPQFGIGLVEGHGIAHHFRMMGDWACAAFCGSLFLSAGMILSYFCMKGEELWWVWRRYKFSLIFLPSLLWSLLMIFNISFKHSDESMTYHLVWLMTAFVTQAFWLSIRSHVYSLFSLRASFSN